MPKGRLVPWCWGGVRRSIGIGEHGCHPQQGWVSISFQRDLGRSMLTFSSTQCPQLQALEAAGTVGKLGAASESWHSEQDGVQAMGWTGWAEEQQQVPTFHCHQCPGGMILQLHQQWGREI